MDKTAYLAESTIILDESGKAKRCIDYGDDEYYDDSDYDDNDADVSARGAAAAHGSARPPGSSPKQRGGQCETVSYSYNA